MSHIKRFIRSLTLLKNKIVAKIDLLKWTRLENIIWTSLILRMSLMLIVKLMKRYKTEKAQFMEWTLRLLKRSELKTIWTLNSFMGSNRISTRSFQLKWQQKKVVIKCVLFASRIINLGVKFSFYRARIIFISNVLCRGSKETMSAQIVGLT